MLYLPFLIAAFANDDDAPPPPDEEADEDDGAETRTIPYAVPYVPPPVVEPPKYQPPIPRSGPIAPTPAPTANTGTHYAPAAPALNTGTRYTPLAEDTVQQNIRSGLVAFSVEGGYELLVGSHMDAWTSGPVARLNVDVQDATTYRAFASWGIGLHALRDPNAIWGQAGDDVTGRSQLHTLLGGGRYYLANTAKQAGVRIVPFVGGAGGLMLTVSKAEVLGLSTTTTRIRLLVEGTAGAELRVGRAMILAGGRVGLIPLVQKSNAGKVGPSGFLPIAPFVGVGWTL